MREGLILSLLLLLWTAGPAQLLKEYESFAHFDVKRYPQQYSRTFDAKGVIMQKNQYHALTISIYGIMSYDEFIRTGDSTYYRHVVNQYKYFQDTTNLMYSDNRNCVGLPYRFAFKGLRPPWYSGMTQGTAVSFLLRYYNLTKNREALALCEKLINLQLKPEEQGGTLARSKEGGPWIEEYPKLKNSKSVLNGFINGLIGLHEYCLHFPHDAKAALIRDSCYNEMIVNVNQYDTPSWTSYARNGGSITASYMRYELEEFDHLYSLFGDERLRTQMRIWSKFAVNKLDKELLFLKNPNYQSALPVPGNPATDTSGFSNAKLFATGMEEVKPYKTRMNVQRFRFTGERYYCELKMTGEEADARKINASASYQGQDVVVTCTYSQNLVVIQSTKPFDALRVKIPAKIRRSGAVSLKAYNYARSELPMFLFYDVTKKETLKKGQTCSFLCEGKNLTNATVLFRYSPQANNLQTKKFHITQSFKLDGGSFEVPVDGTYEFFISYDLTHPDSYLHNLKMVTNQK